MLNDYKQTIQMCVNINSKCATILTKQTQIQITAITTVLRQNALFDSMIRVFWEGLQHDAILLKNTSQAPSYSIPPGNDFGLNDN